MRSIELTISVHNARTDEWALRETRTCDDESHVNQKVQEAIAWYGEKQGFRIRWSAWELWETIASGKWGYKD
jgi:hypothetical protein